MAPIRLPRLLQLPFQGRRETGAPEGRGGVAFGHCNPNTSQQLHH